MYICPHGTFIPVGETDSIKVNEVYCMLEGDMCYEKKAEKGGGGCTVKWGHRGSSQVTAGQGLKAVRGPADGGPCKAEGTASGRLQAYLQRSQETNVSGPG